MVSLIKRGVRAICDGGRIPGKEKGERNASNGWLIDGNKGEEDSQNMEDWVCVAPKEGRSEVEWYGVKKKRGELVYVKCLWRNQLALIGGSCVDESIDDKDVMC